MAQSCSSFSVPTILSVVLAVTNFIFMHRGFRRRQTVKRAEDLCRILHTTYDGVTVSASIGICYFPEHGRDFDKLVHLADVAAYVVKERGKGGYHVYEPGDKI